MVQERGDMYKVHTRIMAGGTTMLLFMLLVILTAGCSPRGYVKASEVAGVVHLVADRHDSYVAQDGTLSALQKRTYMRSARILRKTVDEADAETDPEE